MTRYAARLLLLAALGTVAGCEASDLVDIPDEAELAEQAVAAMLSPLFVEAAAIPSQPALASGPERAPFGYEVPVSETRPCASGGQVAREGVAYVSGDDETNVIAVVRSTTLDFQGCAVPSGGSTYTVSSTPSSFGVLAFTIETTDGDPTLVYGSVTNVATVSTSGFEQTCDVQLSFESSTISSSSVTLSVHYGSACGQDLTGKHITVPL